MCFNKTFALLFDSELVLKMKEITKKRKEEDEQRAAEARKRR